MDGACKARQSCRAAAHFPMVCMREIRDGRSTTTKMAGKMQNTRGKIFLPSSNPVFITLYAYKYILFLCNYSIILSVLLLQ